MSALIRRSWLLALLASLCACQDPPTSTSVVVTGLVSEAVTGTPMSGVQVSVHSGKDRLASVRSDEAGKFLLQFDWPVGKVSGTVQLLARLEGYDAHSINVEVDRGRPSQSSYAMRLLADGLAFCVQRSRPAVVVGHFRPAPGRPDPNLSERIADTLRYDLMEQIQKAEFDVDRQPGIFPCDAAEPKILDNYGDYAELLGADAYVGGYVTSPAPVKVKDELAVADGFGVLDTPLGATSADVDLDDPRLARLAPEANAAILTALVIGYQRSGKPQECVDLLAASERLLGTLTPPLLKLREECQAELPNRGLL